MQRYFSNKKINNTFLLNEDDWYHINTVMRNKNGDKIEVVYENELYICEIKNNQANIIEMVKIENSINKNVCLVLPLLQEQKMSLVLQKATELGISEIIPILTERSKIKITDNSDKKVMRWQRICKEAAEQSKRLDIPKVYDIVSSFNKLDVEGFKMVCSTREKENTLKKVLKNNLNCDKIVIVVGPEGGLAPSEEDFLISNGFIPVSLGNNIMRVETVPIYLLSVLNYVME